MYSLNTPQTETEAIMELVVKQLALYGIQVTHYDKSFHRCTPSDWLEHQLKSSPHAVLCVCNGDFKDEWEKGGDSPIRPLRHLLFGAIQRGCDCSHYAVIKTKRNFADVPSFLQTCTAFNIGEAEEMARFVTKQVKYSLLV